ncbi:protein of unknown function DUF552, partial [Limnospira maxima CS-328]
MNTLFSKLRDFVGLNESVEYDYEYDEMEGEQYQNMYQAPQPQAAPLMSEEERRGSRRPRERAVAAVGGGNMTSESVTMGSTGMNNVIGMPGAINGISEVMV